MATQNMYATMMVEALVNHITLPPRLPGRQDARLDRVEPGFIALLLNAISKLGPSGDHDLLRRSLQSCKVVNAGGRLHKASLLVALRELQPKDFLILHVGEQNAGLVIRRDHQEHDDTVIFEAFEVSPLSEDVLASKNALQWDFPGCAVALPLSKFNEPSFQDELTAFLEKASTESIKRFAARTNKAGSFAFESRDTVDPSLVTQILMTLLEVNGTRAFPPILRKRVRDDVCWDGAENPWRRAPFWLLLRVAIQRHLSTAHGGDIGRIYYKFLMCLVVSRLLDEALPHLIAEVLVHIKTKLCRRLVKLEVERQRAPANLRAVYDSMFEGLRPIFYKTTTTATQRLDDDWNRFKKSIERPVLKLPKHADQRHLFLTLPNSGNYIKQILTHPLHLQGGIMPAMACQLPQNYDASVDSAKPSMHFARRYFALSRLEAKIEVDLKEPPASTSLCEERCIQLSKTTEGYITTSAGAYDFNPEQKSIMLLTIMELWKSMDECAIKLFPLLKQYNPCFSEKMLEVLQLSRLQDLDRLQKIRTYLHDRVSACKESDATIFDDPKKGCFAERYYNESPESLQLQDLHRQIEIAAELAKSEKKRDWQEKSAEYERLIKQIAETACLYTTDEFQNKIHNERQCTKCFLERKAGRFRITAHEHPLPVDSVLAKTVIFELSCPKAFAAYRDTSWRIFGSLALTLHEDSRGPHVLLQDYSELRCFSKSMNSRFSLGSTTKSFLITHYANPRFPVGLADICLPNGLKLKYFDTLLKVWPGTQLQKASFSRHCQLHIPSNSPFAALQSILEFAADANGPSSYQVVASQTKCPSGLNIHEFMAFQSLVSGKIRRWHQILLELGSASLNFGTEATTALMGLLALQAGPSYQDNPLGAVHRVFLDGAFCKRFGGQLDQRLDYISSNYRETNSMETIITFILRLNALGRPASAEHSKLLEKARKITFNWITALRFEIQTATDAETSRRCSRYAFWSSLLCRRTFVAQLNNEDLNSSELQYFIGASIAMQDNMVSDPDTLPVLLKNALVRDLKLIHRLRYVLRRSLEASPGSLISSITMVWPDVDGDMSRSFSRFEFLDNPDQGWVHVTVDATSRTIQQSVHFNILEGHLLVMGKPVGKLPAEYRTSALLQQLFGNQSLLTYPSSLPGMTYRLAITPNGHQIHLGFRNGTLVIRALAYNTILEVIPRSAFGRDPRNFDLPEPLVEGCVHWLDIQTGIIEIRQNPIWKPKLGNWRLDFNTRRATRRGGTLVDPHSPLFARVAQIFGQFEYPHQLTVFQPQTRPLSVELRRLELSFFVNGRNLLESYQLQSEIDTNQDAGTWYGLDSKIVLREIIQRRNPCTQRLEHSVPGTQRSVIVPMGDIRYKRVGPHVRINFANNGDYARYTINDVLGRLDCPAEPRLLYLKALYHAYTSFVLPDSLTGRTGTEEALHCLTSGYCQPWAPLTFGPNLALRLVAKLTPKREYYPKDLKVMQKTSWDPHLTTTIQYDGFRAIAEGIKKKSERLSIFSLQKAELDPLDPSGDGHLTLRSHSRRGCFLRPNAGPNAEVFPDIEYKARDGWRSSTGRSNVFEVANLIRNWPSKVSTTADLAGILQRWSTIGGHKGSFGKVLLTDLLEVDFALHWGSLVNLCNASDCRDTYRLMFLFGIMSFRQDVNMDAVRTLVAFAVLRNLKAISQPQWSTYSHFRQNQVPRLDFLLQLMKTCVVPYAGDERSTFEFALSHKQRKKFESAKLAHEQQQETDAKILAVFLLKQWPCTEPVIEGFSTPVLVDIGKSLEIIRPEWLRLFQNFELSNYLERVQSVLDDSSSDDTIHVPIAEAREQDAFPTRVRGGEFPSLEADLLSKGGTRAQSHPVTRSLTPNGSRIANGAAKHQSLTTTETLSHETDELQMIIDSLIKSKSHVQQQYGADLMKSLHAFRNSKSTLKIPECDISPTILPGAISNARNNVCKSFNQLCATFEFDDSRVLWLQQGGLWPAITVITLLENLRSTSGCMFGENMKENLITYALSITTLQRLLRLEDAYIKSNPQKVNDEQQNRGHTNWKPHDQTDWLLLEVDSNMLIRATQIDVTHATISPASQSNSVLQMNMGQGKTSCIMPMAAAVLANGHNLHRVVVPKSLLLQTAQLLHARLGGLLGREIRHVPFSRKTLTTRETIKVFFEIHKEIQTCCGVMLALPEHLLSFALSGLQRLSDGRINDSKSMIKVQEWLRKHSRDVLDECDNILAIRTQLIYPSGSQKTVDGHPHRWEIAEILLSRIDGHLWNLQRGYPQSLEVIRRRQGGFPVAFFLRKDVEDELIARLVDDIYRGRTSILPPDCTRADRTVIKHFISEPKVSSHVVKSIRELYPDKPAVKQAIHLLRGLFVHRILLMALKKRWNVQYGLHPGRDPIAVPFMAKGTPSEQAEWGHPDVAILFTCLAFYYDGLSTLQVRQTLEHVLKSDDPSQVYDRFSQFSNLPDSLREWNAINVDDEAQLKEISHHLRYSVAVVDYFLNNFVFPRHAKQFQMKLQASGWDLPLFSAFSQSSNRSGTLNDISLTTGFSGTNDWKRMLPLTIEQHDLSGLAHTNAEVLTYILESRSRNYVLAADVRGRHISELDLLKKIHAWGIRVLIDAGAQILEMDNLTLAKAWLEIAHEAPAAVYFDDLNKPCVLYRHGHKIPLLASPYADDLGECLVYLDEAHTRGTDLKIPAKARGALTLGLGQTKDHTVQAAMRLRQLGTTQAVVFFAPPEVHQSILDLRKKKSGDHIDSFDVVCWLLEQTCNGIEQLQPLYFSQGADFCHRVQAALDNSDFLADPEQREAYMGALRQVEQQTLEQLYGINMKTKCKLQVGKFSSGVASFMKELNTRRKGFQDTGNAVHGSALQEVEQEREVAYEVEAVREVQKAVHYLPHGFPGLHKDIINFAKTGRLAAGSTTCIEAFIALGKLTTLGRKHVINSSATSGNLYVSHQFMRTINPPLDRPYDQFQRQVNWILWSEVTQIALIVIPEEAEQLLDLVNEGENSPTHLLLYAAPVTRKMLHFNNLQYYAVPSLPMEWSAPMWLRIELGIFSGRLYFEFSEYGSLLSFLGIKEDAKFLEEEEDEEIPQVDGTNEEEEDNEKPPLKSFTRKPLSFLQEWLAIRRKGQDFAQTPMGFVCQGKPLPESHPFFTKPELDNAQKQPVHVRRTGAPGMSEEEDDVEEDFCGDDAYGVDVGADDHDNFDDSDLKHETVECSSESD